MAQKPILEFHAEASHIASTSGLPRSQVAADLGVGFPTWSRWIRQDRRNPEKPSVQSGLEHEGAELRKENRKLRKEENVLLCVKRQMGLACVEEYRRHIPGSRLCEFKDVGPRG